MHTPFPGGHHTSEAQLGIVQRSVLRAVMPRHLCALSNPLSAENTPGTAAFGFLILRLIRPVSGSDYVPTTGDHPWISSSSSRGMT